MTADDDVERFLWEVETNLSDLPGDRRIEALKQLERDLAARAEAFALRDGRDRVEWHDYVQATAELGPPEALAASILGRPLRHGRAPRRAFVLAAIAAILLAAVLVAALLGPNDHTEAGRWSGGETSRTGAWNATFDIAPDAEAVRLDLSFVPLAPGTGAHIYVFDGATDLVFEAVAVVPGSLQTTRFVEGAPGTWRILIDFDDFRGPWSVTAYEAR